MPGVGHFGIALKDISFRVHAGEIFGIAGVAGNGQNALLLALSGEATTDDAQAIRIDGAARSASSTPRRGGSRGSPRVPEERNGHAAVPDFTLTRQFGAHRRATG